MPNRPFLFSLVLIALTCFWACWCDTAMLWDGAFQLCQTLLSGRPFSYLSRFHSWVVWLPVPWLARHTGSMELLKFVYGLPFCLAPAVSVLLSWWVLRRAAPHMMIWALLGAVVAPLPGQIFMINDSIFQLHLFWPVFLATFVTLSRPQLIVLSAVSLFQLSHPIGIGLCAGMTLAAGAAARWGRWDHARARTFRAVWWGLLAVLGVFKLRLWPDPYAASEATWEQAKNTLLGGVLGWPLPGLVAVWIAAWLLLHYGAHVPSRKARRAGVVAVALILLCGALWLYWAADPWRWRGALNYRRWVVPMSAPFFLAAAREFWRAERAAVVLPASAWRGRRHAGLAAAAVFAAVLGTQAATCRYLFARLGEAIQNTSGPWLRESDLGWARDTALGHWGLHAQVLVAQGRQPHLLLWNEAAADGLRRTPAAITLAPFAYQVPAHLTHGWFQWHDLPAPPPATDPSGGR